MKSRNLLVGVFASATIIIGSVAASASTILSDGNFAGTIDVGAHSSDPFAGVAGSVCGTPCGNPGSALFAGVSSQIGGPLSTSDVGFVDHSLSYDPTTQGAIASINASYDRKLTPSFAINVPFNFRLVIEQGGVDYVTAVNLGGSDTGFLFHNLSVSDLVASQFSSFNFSTGVGGSAHPDFTGGQMLFGVMALVQTQNGQSFGAFFDNINITVNQTPLPGALPLFTGGVGLVGLLARRRKRAAR
jgi:hypothetical protein